MVIKIEASLSFAGAAGCILYLLATVGRQIEREHGQKRDAHARNDDVDRVEQRLAAHRNVERDVQIRFVAARVEFLIAANRTKCVYNYN